jgi:hypothetical protein
MANSSAYTPRGSSTKPDRGASTRVAQRFAGPRPDRDELRGARGCRPALALPLLACLLTLLFPRWSAAQAFTVGVRVD